jgi:two-component system OmpR family response regulator/two-component system response regulator RstA
MYRAEPAMSSQTTILIVEDDRELAELLQERLRGEGFVVAHAADGPAAVAAVAETPPDIVLLDVGLPGFSGYEVCRRIRPRFGGAIIFVTARDDELDQVLGLELGGDDYVVKPVPTRVLIARIRALLRRDERHTAGDAIARCGPFTVDPTRREIRVGAGVVPVTTAEFDLFAFLAAHAGQIVSRDELYRGVLRMEYDGLDRTIDVQISRLRNKLEAASPGSFDTIRTVRGSGYLAVGADQ